MSGLTALLITKFTLVQVQLRRPLTTKGNIIKVYELMAILEKSQAGKDVLITVEGLNKQSLEITNVDDDSFVLIITEDHNGYEEE